MTEPAAPVCRALWLPREGHEEGEYEDAYALPTGGPPWRFAVADGATESVFARDWAHRLAEGVAAVPLDTDEAVAAALATWRSRWRAWVAAHAGGMPWYAAQKVEEGAHAAVLGLTLRADGRWQALAVGDCNLVHVRGDDVLLAWPLDDAAAFHHRPVLLSSHPTAPLPPVLRHEGTFLPGDAFLLATDALAAWLLRAGPSTARRLAADDFGDRVRQARADRSLRNDDVTLVVIES